MDCQAGRAGAFLMPSGAFIESHDVLSDALVKHQMACAPTAGLIFGMWAREFLMYQTSRIDYYRRWSVTVMANVNEPWSTCALEEKCVTVEVREIAFAGSQRNYIGLGHRLHKVEVLLYYTLEIESFNVAKKYEFEKFCRSEGAQHL